MTEFRVGDRVKHRSRRDLGTIRAFGPGPTVVVRFDEQKPEESAHNCHSGNLTVVPTEEPVFGGTLKAALATAHGGPDFAGVAAELTLLHELLHMALALGGAHLSSGGMKRGYVEEHVVRVLEGPLLGLLRDNPQLIAYLTEK